MDEKAFADATQVEDGSGAHQAVKFDGEVVLVADSAVQRIPVASADPNDPLNYSKLRKFGVMVTTCWFCKSCQSRDRLIAETDNQTAIFSLLSLAGLGSFFNTLFHLYGADHTPDEIVGLSTYPTMLMAVGCLVLLPIAMVIGRRPVFIISVLVCLICYITAGTSQTFSQHFISRIFVGIATGAVESLLPLVIADVTFLDERGFYFGIYWSTQNCVSSGILIGLPYLIADAGWRWFYWLFVITMAISFIFAFFLLPETRFARLPITLSGKTIHTDEFGHTMVLDNEEAMRRFGHIDADMHAPEPKRTYLQELKPWSKLAPNALKVWCGAYIKIGKAFTSPAVIWALLLSSISLGIGIAVSLIYSVVLEVGYEWSPGSVGLFNIGIIPASFLAMAYSGWFGDKVNLWLAKRNGGVHRPEHQLVNLIFPCVAGVVGLVALALPANNPEKYSVWGMLIGEFTKSQL